MKSFLYKFLDLDEKRSIESTHMVQKNIYGVCEPPLLRQLISLRHLLIRTGNLNDDELQSEELLGLSRIECKILLKKLNKIYTSQRRSQHRSKT